MLRTLPAAGALMRAGVEGWPWFGLVGGGIHLGAGGREAARVPGPREGQVRVGAAPARRLALAVLGQGRVRSREPRDARPPGGT